jgi:hypothetical protein
VAFSGEVLDRWRGDLEHSQYASRRDKATSGYPAEKLAHVYLLSRVGYTPTQELPSLFFAPTCVFHALTLLLSLSVTPDGVPTARLVNT